MSSPAAILISDIHFNLANLELSSKALEMAVDKNNKLMTYLIIAGDLHDSKAIIRAEVANRLISILKKSWNKPYILVGNHDLINEKGSEHGLNYLRPYAYIIDAPLTLSSSSSRFDLNLHMIPYQSDSDKLTKYLKDIRSGKKIIFIMHQGFQGAAMGDYVVDKTSISPSLFKDDIVYSGHYHRHQTIGQVTYIGNPFTMSFGEANDGPKGFLILNSDGSYSREIVKFRKHIIHTIDLKTSTLDSALVTTGNSDDLIWLKIYGNTSQLAVLNKTDLGQRFFKHNNFKLELISTDSEKIELQDQNLTVYEIFDKIIEATGEAEGQKKDLKELYREIIED